jgi:hypothetical protein
MMEEAFYEFLVLHGAAPLEGIGRFTASNGAVRTDATNHLLHPGNTTWQFSNNGHSHADTLALLAWLQNALPENSESSETRYRLFVSDIRQQLQNGQVVSLPHIGELSQDAGGQTVFNGYKTSSFLPPVTANRIIRKDEVHSMVVGENERTNVEMAEMLQDAGPRKSRWWIAASILALAAATLITLHFMKTSSIGSRQAPGLPQQNSAR